MSKTKKLALSSVLSALGVAIMYVGALVGVLDLTMIAVASLIIIFAVIEFGGLYPWLIYAVTGVLALILLPDKLCPLLYLLFAGMYPIFKEIFERLHPAVGWVLKFSMFNTALLIAIVLSEYLLHIPDTGLGFNIVVFGLGNLVFLIYDIALTKLITFYIIKLRRRMGLGDYFGRREK